MIPLLTVHGTTLTAGDKTYVCSVGRAGVTADKREGDLATPAGTFALRWCYWRPDRFAAAPQTQLPLMEITERDGWCDDVAHAWYNQPVTLPFEGRHEQLWRSDGIYDLVIPLGYNDGPIIPGKGSAIFLHIMREDGEGTAGCVALKRDDLLALMPQLSAKTNLVVSG